MDENTSARAGAGDVKPGGNESGEVKPGENEPGEVKPEFDIKVTADKLSVYVRVSAKLADTYRETGIKFSESDISALLGNNGVKYGILEDEVKSFCGGQNVFQWQKVAIGTHAVDGEDGSFSLTFDSESKGPKQREDGTVDYRELNLIKNVYAGEVLCNIVLPAPGEDGTDVYGNVIQAKVGKAAHIETGNNVLITEDGTELHSATDGCVYFRGGKVYVEEAYSVKEDVGLKTGNINFNGTIHISGSVLEGFKVHAEEDIYVKGLVEGAELTAGGNIVIAGGVTGMNTARITAAGDITAKFIENATVICGGNLMCDIILRSNVKAEKSITMRGERAAIIGGTTLAGEKITAKTLGSDKFPKQEVAVRRNWKLLEGEDDEDDEEENIRDKEEKAAIEESKKKLAMAQEYLEMFQAKIAEENKLGPQKNIKLMKEYMIKKSEFSAVVASLKSLLDSYKTEDFITSITCTGFIYPGVRLRIDNSFMTITAAAQNQKFFVDSGEIVTGAVLPGGGDAGQ